MICYYNKGETDFSHNGLGVLDDNIISPVVTEELNGVFKLEFDYPTHAPHGDGLTPERIIRCPVPDMQDQLFRVSEREASISGLFHIVAYHVFYDLSQNIVEDTFITYKNGAQALAQLLGATQFSHGFTSSSNIAKVSTARMVRLNAAAAILDSNTDNSYISRWGGEIIRDRFFISLQAVRGSNNGVQIRDKKNLTGYRADVDYGTVATRIMPEGYDGLFLPEKYVDSPRIGDYQTPRIRVVRYDKVKAAPAGEAPDPEKGTVSLADAYAALRSLAAAEFSASHADLPACAYSIEFAPLERTEEYKQFSALETVHMGDVVSVVHEEDGLDISARMVSYRYDPLAQAYISIELGTAAPKFTSAVSEIKSAAVSAVISAVESGTVVLPQAGNDRASTYYGANEPSGPRVGDLWYKDNGDKLELWIYESRGGVAQWWALITDMTNEEMRQTLEQAKSESADALAKANLAYDDAVSALGTTTTLTGRVSEAEATLTAQAGQIAAKASQSAVDTLTGRVTSAESAIVQNADSFNLSLSKTTKAVNGLAGASILQAAWAQGTLSTSTGAESASTSYARSGLIDVAAGKKYLLQTYEGASSYSVYGTAYLFYFREDKTFLSYATSGSSAAPFTVPANAAYLRVRLTTAISPATVSCYLLQTDAAGGFTDLTTMTNMLKLQATSDTLLVTVGETKAAIGARFMVPVWERGTLSTSTGAEAASTTNLRSGFIDVRPANQYVAQLRDGTAVTAYFHFYGLSVPYVDYVPAAKQYVATLPTGTYDNDGIEAYLVAELDAAGLSITGAVSTNPYTSSGDCLVIYRLPLDGKAAPASIRWSGRKDTSDGIALLYTNGWWERIGTVTASANAAHDWALTDGQRAGIEDDVLIAFFSIKTGSYAGIYNASAAPFALNPMGDSLLYQVSYTGTSSYATVPANAAKMRVRVATAALPEEYAGNVYAGTARADYSGGDTLYSALLMQKDLINLRVAKNDVVNQINVSTEGILISGSKVHITGQTTIDSAVIQSAMIASLAVTNAKIADATIQSAKIAAIDAAKITTGTLVAARIGANSITADKVSAHFLEALTGGSAIRITGTTISYYSGSALTSQINANGFELTRDSAKIGRIGTNSFQQNSAWRGLVFDLEYSGNYMSWSWKESSTASTYTTKFTYYRSKLQDGMERGFHFDDTVYFKSGLAVASGSSVVTNHVGHWTFSSTSYLARTTANSKAGVALGASSLILGSGGTWVDLNTLRAICAQLAGKTVYLPASSSGLSSWWSVSFPSMTTWST